MRSPDTELLEVAVAGAERVTLRLVPVLCGVVVAASWVAGCLAIVLPA